MNVAHTLKLSTAALVAALSLNACLPLLGGAAVGVAASSADRRTTGAQTDDEVMELRVKTTAISTIKNITGVSPEISVVSHNRHILLLGQVSDEASRQTAERIARAEKSAVAVYNYINIDNSGRTLSDRSKDTWITSRVSANLLGLSKVYRGHTKVVTYNGITYVMGILTPEQQAVVTETVSTTSGVQKVITLYQTLNTNK